RIVPTFYGVDVIALLTAAVALKSFEELGEIALGDLKLVRHGDAVSVVPDRNDHRHADHAGGIDRLPEHPLGAARVTDRAPRDLVAAVRELRHLFHLTDDAIELRRVAESDEPRHLR